MEKVEMSHWYLLEIGHTMVATEMGRCYHSGLGLFSLNHVRGSDNM